ncbi:TPA: response regulator transcription factor [Streptococcus equi subsp. zooepidemicus]|uniref:Transcriptional regulatory protein DltR n=1 Tax=Streptococcus equi subsp. ruminatorum CECT 5772 TaxID=1051981 RepID=A0A922NSR6_9STRE|nr:response regulator transcription factor [Streptococcus equi]HEK9992300.1 response regulator transcription factor [Streptococcus equi subsp. zooepidemicus]HEL1012510.1 response regulator transcription factor [Streptococcus equi subsp. ruminatorum]KED03539.1 winged helix family two component transcriptional regulator [Streptococcus equi subsp. ruminatorum CECT 5772]HEL0247571.1 response regulator transcription factor [Streptococcus equi subsp. zooepidemicus]HEL1024617.1 response regulator tra
MAYILLVEDDVVINQIVIEFLKAHDHTVISVFDGYAALEAFSRERFDLIILDIMIPEISGLDVLKQIRQTSVVPIIMLTALDDEYTQLISFNQTISDYVVKPFSPLILMKRIENVLRQSQVSNEIQIGQLRLDLDNSTAYYGSNTLALTKTEYDILELLAKHCGKLVTRDNMMMSIWGYSELDSRVLDNHIKNIRKKIPNLILSTIVGRGYKLEGTNYGDH